MHDFVALDVHRPIGVFRNGGIGLVCFCGKHLPSFAQRWVPNGVDDADFVRIDALNQRPGPIVRISNSHHHLVAQRQDALNRLDNGVVKADSLIDEGES